MMTRNRYLILLLGVIFGLCESGDVRAISAQVIENERYTCDWATARVEQETAIPTGLLKAISLAETGRWHAEDKESFAWPWTVTSGGPGKYFPSKGAAITYVRRLQAQGITNIDVGCMQINLGYHGEHFKNLSQAFDPNANASYAADFLKQLYSNTGSWDKAAGQYHSKTPKRLKYYLSKLEKLRDQHLARVGEAAASFDTMAIKETVVDRDFSAEPDINAAFDVSYGASPQAAGKLRPRVKPDFQRTALLNAGLAKGNDAEPAKARETSQLALLREGDNRTVSFATASAMHRARALARDKQELQSRMQSAKRDRFAKRRVAQLRDWRLKRAGRGAQ